MFTLEFQCYVTVINKNTTTTTAAAAAPTTAAAATTTTYKEIMTFYLVYKECFFVRF